MNYLDQWKMNKIYYGIKKLRDFYVEFSTKSEEYVNKMS